MIKFTTTKTAEDRVVPFKEKTAPILRKTVRTKNMIINIYYIIHIRIDPSIKMI